ncbi:hypothetical protein V8G54_025394 [Vigna mungo]|uniref:NAF domain-containing protein n=1 Tax=Vigna mungo TaxID=3915 RepID=A0AAQ3MWV4_VIGMU
MYTLLRGNILNNKNIVYCIPFVASNFLLPLHLHQYWCRCLPHLLRRCSSPPTVEGLRERGRLLGLAPTGLPVGIKSSSSSKSAPEAERWGYCFFSSSHRLAAASKPSTFGGLTVQQILANNWNILDETKWKKLKVRLDIPTMYKKISRRDYQFPDWISKPARYVIYKLLDLNPETRMDLEALFGNLWFKKSLNITRLFETTLDGGSKREKRFTSSACVEVVEEKLKEVGGILGFKVEAGKTINGVRGGRRRRCGSDLSGAAGTMQ